MQGLVVLFWAGTRVTCSVSATAIVSMVGAPEDFLQKDLVGDALLRAYDVRHSALLLLRNYPRFCRVVRRSNCLGRGAAAGAVVGDGVGVGSVHHLTLTARGRAGAGMRHAMPPF